ncbi:TadE/TadG family type IV pilus assembly protein [Sphingobium sp. AN641]|uniref:TadE/TadG family type IV pilus assembly protein n=1 Tax=Sphingobium sp. AN641 TaxID=3133443 RepID=UPI0030C20BCD
MTILPHIPARRAPLRQDERGSLLVEAAFAVPLLVSLLFGLLIYGSWFMAAHCIQQAANDAARTAVAGLDAAERRTLVDTSVAASLAGAATVRAANVTVSTSLNQSYYTVTLDYDLTTVPLFRAILFPLPAAQIRREAVVRLTAV